MPALVPDDVTGILLQGGPAGAAAGPGYRFVFYLRQQSSDNAAEDDADQDSEDMPPKRVAVTLPPPVRHRRGHSISGLDRHD